MGKTVYLLGACRTAIGKFGGSLKSVKAADLGAEVIKASLERAGVDAKDVDEVFMGNVLQAAQGQSPARQMAIKAGIPVEIPATTLNKVCGSSLHAVTIAYRSILAGEADCVVAGGAESMSNAPYAMPAARWGARMGNSNMIDTMVNDGLWDVFNNYHMGVTAENVAAECGVTREMQDEFALKSQQKAEAAIKAGAFKEEIVPVAVPQRKGDPVVFDTDEHPMFGSSAEKLAKLRPAFIKDGTVTAGNASGINDGAACVIVASEEFVKEHDLKPMAKIVATGSKGVDPKVMGLGPIPSVKDAYRKSGLSTADIAVFEANEAFAAQAVQVGRELEIPEEKLNPKGGAIALGHPIGGSGCRILVTLLHELEAGQKGVATLCIGGGMGEAVIVEKM